MIGRFFRLVWRQMNVQLQIRIFNQYTIRITSGDRDRVQERLAREGIDTMIYYPVPCHRLQVYAHSHAAVACPEAESACGQVLSLPMWPGMEPELQEEVAAALQGNPDVEADQQLLRDAGLRPAPPTH